MSLQKLTTRSPHHIALKKKEFRYPVRLRTGYLNSFLTEYTHAAERRGIYPLARLKAVALHSSAMLKAQTR